MFARYVTFFLSFRTQANVLRCVKLWLIQNRYEFSLLLGSILFSTSNSRSKLIKKNSLEKVTLVHSEVVFTILPTSFNQCQLLVLCPQRFRASLNLRLADNESSYLRNSVTKITFIRRNLGFVFTVTFQLVDFFKPKGLIWYRGYFSSMSRIQL